MQNASVHANMLPLLWILWLVLCGLRHVQVTLKTTCFSMSMMTFWEEFSIWIWLSKDQSLAMWASMIQFLEGSSSNKKVKEFFLSSLYLPFPPPPHLGAPLPSLLSSWAGAPILHLLHWSKTGPSSSPVARPLFSHWDLGLWFPNPLDVRLTLS